MKKLSGLVTMLLLMVAISVNAQDSLKTTIKKVTPKFQVGESKAKSETVRLDSMAHLTPQQRDKAYNIYLKYAKKEDSLRTAVPDVKQRIEIIKTNASLKNVEIDKLLTKEQIEARKVWIDQKRKEAREKNQSLQQAKFQRDSILKLRTDSLHQQIQTAPSKQ